MGFARGRAVTDVLISDVSFGDQGLFHVVISDGCLTEKSRSRSAAFSRSAIDGQGGCLLPALHDHHHHLWACAARDWSVDISDAPDATAARSLIAVQACARVTGYDEAQHGRWERTTLDELFARDLPLRVQHRSGHMWVLNSAALAELGLDDLPQDGRFYDEDQRLARYGQPDALRVFALETHIRRLLDRGVMGVTDMTETLTASTWDQISTHLPDGFHASAYGTLGGGLPDTKIVMADHALPDIDSLNRMARSLPDNHRLAVHAVTYEALVLAVVGLREAAGRCRIEHAFLADADMAELLRDGGFSVGVQPGFIWSQGDRLLRELGQGEIEDYQRLRDFLDRGIALFGGTDAPFAPLDPWRAMAAAVRRRTRSGQILGAAQALTPEEAFALFTKEGLQHGADHPMPLPGAAGVMLMAAPWDKLRLDLAQASPRRVFTA